MWGHEIAYPFPNYIDATEITYPFPNFIDATIEVWKMEMDNLSIPQFTGHVINYPCWYSS